MEERLYRIEELCTTGWELVDPKDTDMTKERTKDKFHLNVMLLQSGFIIITGLFTIAVGLLVASGDSTISKPSASTLLSTPKQSVIK